MAEFVEERGDRLLTIRVTEAWLVKEPVETLYVELNENLEVLTSSGERKKHFETASSDWFQKQLEEWSKPEITKVRIADPDHPLEAITADVCLTLRIEGKEYIVNIFRDIYPKGWLIPGGCPRNLEEVFNPRVTAGREMCEEVLIGDTRGRAYSFCPSRVELMENIQSWNLTPAKIVPLSTEELYPKRGDAQNLILRMGDRETRTENINVTIDPQTASIPVTLYWRISLPIKLSELQIFDGEKREKDRSLINRAVRITDKGGSVAAIFVSGQNILLADWVTQKTRERVIP